MGELRRHREGPGASCRLRVTPAVLLLACLAAGLLPVLGAPSRDLSLAERVECQKTIERFYHSHRIGVERPLGEVMPEQRIREKVLTHLKQSVALEQIWDRPVDAAALERELRRIASQTRFPGRLRQLFAALGDDPLVIQECVARPVLVDRQIRDLHAHQPDTDVRGGNPKTPWLQWWQEVEGEVDSRMAATVAEPSVALPALESAFVGPCVPDDTWANGSLDDFNGDRKRYSTVWTGSEMIVWGGTSPPQNTGMRYDPLLDSWSATSRTNAPTPRYDHSAVWTGSEMIVWGGEPFDVDTGGRYNPQTDTWIPLSTVGAPQGRAYHTAVWTGSEMIIWGGHNSANPNFEEELDTGGRYDPVSDSWTPTTTVGAPSAVAQHTAVWTGSEMLIWGGADHLFWNSRDEKNTGARYDPAADQWSPMATPALAGRSVHHAVWTGSEMIVWGGLHKVQPTQLFSDGAAYDPGSDSWATLPPTPVPYGEQSAVWTGTELITWGGVGVAGGARYDPVSMTWTQMSQVNAPPPRDNSFPHAGHAAVWTGDRMIIWGNTDYPVTGGLYDPVSDTWSPTALLPARVSRSGHTAVWTGNKMIVYGGSSDPPGTGDSYDPLLDSWQEIAQGRPAQDHTAVWTGEEMLVWNPLEAQPARFGSRYDPLSDSWSYMSTVDVPDNAPHHSIVWTGSEMIVFGGERVVGGNLRTGGRYHPQTDTWIPLEAPLPIQGRAYHSAVWTGTEMLVWGGTLAPVAWDNGFSYNPVTDQWVELPASGHQRAGHSAVWTGSEMVVLGGSSVEPAQAYVPATGTWYALGGAPVITTDDLSVWTGKRIVVWLGTTGETYDFSSGWQAMATGEAPYGAGTAVWADGLVILWGGTGFNRRNVGAAYVQAGNFDDDDGDGFTRCAGDCDDSSVTRYPGAPELCNALDDDCDLVVPVDELDVDGDGFLACADDCNDLDFAVKPGATEICNNADENCDGINDEMATICGMGACLAQGYCSAGVDDCTPGSPSPEACNGIDDDCDGTLPSDEIDGDADGTSACAGDCDDSDSSTYPDAPEISDTLTNQCPGDFGYPWVDELSGLAGFQDAEKFCWVAQAGAVLYEVLRSDVPAGEGVCSSILTTALCWTDLTQPAAGEILYYLGRSAIPLEGSWGGDVNGNERMGPCPGSQSASTEGDRR